MPQNPKSKSPAEPDIMRLDELAAYLHCSPSTIYRLLKRREIPAFRLVHVWRFHKADIDTWRMTQTASVQPPSRRRT
jgi:excisionase family DNA binding protein